MKFLIIMILSVISLMAQSGTPVTVSEGPSRDLWTSYLSKVGNHTYICMTPRDTNPTTTMNVASISNANPGVFTISGGHGFHADSSPTITVSGGTGGWTAVNGSWVATYINSTTFSIPVNTTSLGAVTGTVVVSTRAPRLTSAIWQVLKAGSDGTNSTSSIWATGGATNVCTSPATLSFQ